MKTVIDITIMVGIITTVVEAIIEMVGINMKTVIDITIMVGIITTVVEAIIEVVEIITNEF